MELTKKYLPKKSLQNLLSILIMLSGFGLALLPQNQAGLLISMIPIFVIIAGASIGIWLLFKRNSSDTKRPGILAVLSVLCWVCLVCALLLLWLAPGIYGYDLAILVNSTIVITWCILLGTLFTTIALLRR
jgi:hypothetical protein